MTEPIKTVGRRRNRSAHARLFGAGVNASTKCSVIVAHPIDEVVGAGCLISKLVNVTILHVTDGALSRPDDLVAAGCANAAEYVKARKHECLEALALANVTEDRVVDLNLPNYRACQCLTDLTRKIAAFLQHSGTEIVVTHPYEGGHPDHDATAFATHAAIRLITEGGLKPPALFEMALHPSADFNARVPEFLPGGEGEMTTLLLDERSRELKRRMFELLATQKESLQVTPLGPERFRKPSAYNLVAPPASGQLHYESFNWAPSCEEWQSLAKRALNDLFPEHSAIRKSALH